jgi:hypothetical protein
VRKYSTSSQIALCLVANKIDLASNGEVRAVPREEGEALARSYQLMYVETSAQTGENVRQAFQQSASAVLRKVDAGLINAADGTHGVRQGFSAEATDADSEAGGQDTSVRTVGSTADSERNKRISLLSSDSVSEGCC